MQTNVNRAHELGQIVSTWSGKPLKSFLAIFVVAIMVVSAFVMLAPVGKAPASTPVAEPAKDVPANTMAGPLNRQVSYTISHMGDANVKDSRDIDGARGRHNSTPGLPEWWLARKTLYSDTVVHSTYPYWVAYNPESGSNSYNGVPHLPYGTYSFYRLYMDATDVSTVATGPNQDLLYLPTLGGVALDGGTVKLTWHSTYLTTADALAMQAGTHYANTYYGVPASVFSPLGTPSYANDGWYWEHTGLIELDVAAAKKYLNVAGADLRTAFNTSNVGGALNISFGSHYWNEGSADAIYDIYACYDYTITTGPTNPYFLKLDPSSTSTNLVLRVYGYTWGFDCLMMRYLDVQGLMSHFVGWAEDYYFNATITTDRAEIHTRATVAYHMTTWKDPAYWGAAWMLEAQHYDYNNYDGTYWQSRFTPYYSYDTPGPGAYTPLRTQWEPGSNNFGTKVAFWNTPHLFNLVAGETLTLKLPTKDTMGYMPYTGTVGDVFPKNGGGNDAKAVEMNTHQQWGELVLGPGTFPSSLFSSSYYDGLSKTLTMIGPTNLARDTSTVGYLGALHPDLNQTGSPMFMFDISPVSNYAMTLPAGPYQTGVAYTLTVTARNLTGVAVATNFTVNLAASAGVTLGASQHVYSAPEGGVWTTTVTFTTTGVKTITATDSLFSLDVVTTLSATVPTTFDLVLYAGWNLVTVPLVSSYKASTLGLVEWDVVSGWNGTAYNQSYTIGHSPARFNFDIEPSTAYWVYVAVGRTLTLSGTIATTTLTKTVTVPVGGGWALVGYESLNATRKASDMKGNYTGGTITTVAARNYTTGLYDTYTGYWRTDFVLKPGQGLWIYVSASGVLSYNP